MFPLLLTILFFTMVLYQIQFPMIIHQRGNIWKQLEVLPFFGVIFTLQASRWWLLSREVCAW